MTKQNLAASVVAMMVCALLGGCAATSDQLLASKESQVKLRSMQTRSFDTSDKEKMLRTVIATLQDLDFVIAKADYTLGTITGEKFVLNNVLKMTVTVRPKDSSQLLVRANAQYGIKAVETPEPYQDFFSALSKAIFLTANNVD